LNPGFQHLGVVGGLILTIPIGKCKTEIWQKILEKANQSTNEHNISNFKLVAVNPDEGQFFKIFLSDSLNKYIAKGIVENNKPCVYIEQLDY